MDGQIRRVIQQKIVDAQAVTLPRLTHRDVWLPSVPGKATAVIGMRRAGKTSLLWQILSERVAAGMPRECLLYFSFEDERLVGMSVDDLDGLPPLSAQVSLDEIPGRAVGMAQGR